MALALALAALGAAAPAVQATFGGENGRLFYAATDLAGSPFVHSIYSMNSDGTGLTRLTHDPAYNDVVPAVSPDGKLVAFARSSADGSDSFWCAGGLSDIVLMTADGQLLANLTDNPSTDDAPAFSPDGRQIAFRSSRTGQADIYVMNTDGTGLRNVTNDPTRRDVFPRWSPDGRSLAFTKTDFDFTEAAVFVIGVDGRKLRQLTPCSLDAGDPDWSPDGQRITFSDAFCDCPQQSDVYVMRANGSHVQRLTNSPGNSVHARFSPEGDRLAYHEWPEARPSEFSPYADIFTIGDDGGRLFNVTATPETGEGGVDWAAAPDPD